MSFKTTVLSLIIAVAIACILVVTAIKYCPIDKGRNPISAIDAKGLGKGWDVFDIVVDETRYKILHHEISGCSESTVILEKIDFSKEKK